MRRMIPEILFPFCKGASRNLFNFCLARISKFAMELSSVAELEQMSVPYTCFVVGELIKYVHMPNFQT